MRFIAQFLSYLFHPIFASLMSMVVLFHLPIYLNYRLTEEYFNYTYLVLIINLVVAPLLVSSFLRRKGWIKSFEMHSVKERIIPYFSTLLFYFFTYYLLFQINFPPFYLSLFRAAILTLLCLFVLATLNRKVSAHLSGLGGICGMLIVVAMHFNIDTTLLLMVGLVVSGAVASARYALEAHSFTQLLTGFTLGVVVQFSCFI